MYSDKGNTENRKGEKEMMNNNIWNGSLEDMMREAGITAEELFGEEEKKEEEGD